MKAKRVKTIATKEIKKIIREPAALFIVILFPLVFVLFFGLAFGEVGGGASAPLYKVGVIVSGNSTGNYTQRFLELLSGTSLFNVQFYEDNSTAQIDLSQGKIQAIIIIPKNFDQSILSYLHNPTDPSKWVNSTLLIYIDMGSPIASQVIPPVIERMLASMINISSEPQMPVNVGYASSNAAKMLSAFELSAPGMFTFASIYIIMIIAQSFTQERDNGLLKRIMVTPTEPAELVLGYVVAYMLIAFVQSVILFLAMYAIGFRPSVDIGHYAVAFLFVLIFSLSNIGLGLVASTISKSASIATGISFIFIMPQLFLGTFIAYSLSPGARLVSEFVPSYYVTDALTTIFLRNAPLMSTTIVYDLLIVSLSSIAILFIGIYLYGKKQRIS